MQSGCREALHRFMFLRIAGDLRTVQINLVT